MTMWSNPNDVVWLWTDAEGQQGGVLMFFFYVKALVW